MKDKSFWIKKLQLLPHPEGGFYKEVFRSEGKLEFSDKIYFDGDRNYMTSIYFLLDDDNFSAFHKIKSDEMWYFHYGDPIKVHVINNEGLYSSFTLGLELNNGHVLSSVVKANCWFASETLNKNGFGLVSCAVAPGFDFSDFLLADESLTKVFPQHKELIKRLLH